MRSRHQRVYGSSSMLRQYASGGDYPHCESHHIPKPETVDGHIDPHCSKRQDHHLQRGSRHWRYERLQSGLIRHSARGERCQTPVPGACGVPLPPGRHTEYVARTAHHYGLQTQGHCADQRRLCIHHELNQFYARFEVSQAANAIYRLTTEDSDIISERPVTSFAEHDVRAALRRVNTRKAAGPDGITGRLLRCCADQLAGVFTYIFNESLAKSVVPTCFKRSTIIPVPKNSKPSSLNDYGPVALTSVVMKVFERLLKNIISSSIPDTTDPLQFAYRPNRSTEDAIAHVLHTTLSHVDKKQGNYVRMLFVDYSSAFNTIVPSRLFTKLRDLGLNSRLCAWVLDFLTGRTQVVRVGRCVSDSITINTGAPQGCVLLPLLYSLYTSDCVATHGSNTIVKFADDTVVLGAISNSDEAAYMDEVKNLPSWCQDNHLQLNVGKTKELVVDFRRSQHRDYKPIIINGAPVERVQSFKYLGVHISSDLTWAAHIQVQTKKARQRLYHLRQLRKFRVSPKILRIFYTGAVESILTQNMTSWFGNSCVKDQKALQRVIRTAERCCRIALAPLQDTYTRRCRTRATQILKDPSHPGNKLFQLLQSGRRFRIIRARTETQEELLSSSHPGPRYKLGLYKLGLYLTQIDYSS
uniref:Reverse transcriptase domain-containing protein n=1 Tax=Oreochromis niloticus TaxID=8128 RepID=A0A669B7J5_ORENI